MISIVILFNFFFVFVEVGFHLKGVIYPPNVTLNLSDIGTGRNSLRCITPLISCCGGPFSSSSGQWNFPNGSSVRSKSGGYNVSRTRGASSLLLHRRRNVMSPTGVYTCEIYVNISITRELYIFLYASLIPGTVN